MTLARHRCCASARALMSVRLVLQQIGLALLVFLLYVLWLRMPDASVLDVIGSALLALIVLAVAGAGESALILRLAGTVRDAAEDSCAERCCCWQALRCGLRWSAAARPSARQRLSCARGYLNSRFPHRLRYFFYVRTHCAVAGMDVDGARLDRRRRDRPLRLRRDCERRAAARHAVARCAASTYWIAVVLGAPCWQRVSPVR